MRIDCSSLSYLWLSCLYSSYTIILFFIIQYSTWFFLYSTELVFIVLTVYLFLSYDDDSIVDSLILIQVYLMYYTWLISFYPLILNLSIKKHQLSYYVSNSLYLVITLLKYSLFFFYCLYLQVYLCYLSLSLSHSLIQVSMNYYNLLILLSHSLTLTLSYSSKYELL